MHDTPEGKNSIYSYFEQNNKKTHSEAMFYRLFFSIELYKIQDSANWHQHEPSLLIRNITCYRSIKKS